MIDAVLFYIITYCNVLFLLILLSLLLLLLLLLSLLLSLLLLLLCYCSLYPELTIGFVLDSYSFSEPPPGSSQQLQPVCIEVKSGMVGTTLIIEADWIEGTAFGMCVCEWGEGGGVSGASVHVLCV